MTRIVLPIYEAIRESLGLNESVEIIDETRLGDLDGSVCYSDLLNIFNGIGGNHLKLKQYFNPDNITDNGVRLLRGLAADLFYNPKYFIKELSGNSPGDYVGNLRPLEIKYIKSRLTQ